MTLLRMSLSAGILIALLLFVRAFTINRLPKRLYPALWGLILARLLLPFSFPVPIALPASAVPSGTAGQALPFPAGGLPGAAVPQGGGAVPVGPPAGAAVSPWMVVWMVGAALCLLYFSAAYWRVRGKLRGSLPVENRLVSEWLAECRLKRRLEVRCCSRIEAPLTYGVFRPVILLPKGMDWSDGTRLRYILQHEYVHVRRFDAAGKLLLTAAVCLHWWNPLVWVMYVLANRDLELACDEAVVRFFGEPSKTHYARALIGMEEQKSGLPSLYSGFSKNAIEERIQAIMKFRKTSLPAIAAAVLIALGFTAAVGVSAATAEPPSGGTTRSPAAGQDQAPADSGKEAAQAVVFEQVELRTYDNGWPYLHDVFTNETDRTIVSMQYYMLGYDRDGAPLEVYWDMLDSSSGAAYEKLVEAGREIAPGQTDDADGGWSLYDGKVMENWNGDQTPNRVAYALYCPWQITFADGAVWRNPACADWLSAYRGRAVDVSVLEGYYPCRWQVSPSDIPQGSADGRTPQGTEADYRSLLALKTPGYQNETVERFTGRVLDWANESHAEHEGRYERIEGDMAQTLYPRYLTEEEGRFLSLTVRASDAENSVRTRSAYSGLPAVTPDLSFTLQKGTVEGRETVPSNQPRSARASLSYGISYRIDPARVTVGERDAALAGAVNGVQSFWESTSVEALAAMGENRVRERIGEILAENGTPSVKLGFVDNYFLFDAALPDEA